MKRILICWEHGTGLGHIVRLLPFARAFKKKGHCVAFAVHETTNTHAIFEIEDFQWFQAPMNNLEFDEQINHVHFYNYCRMIMCHDYHRFDALLERVRKWEIIFNQFKPDVVIFEFSPGAYITSLAFDVKRIMIGTGFTIPPLQYPFPCYKYMPNNMTFEQRKNIEDQVTENINNILAKINAKSISYLFEICKADLRLLMTYEELDYYKRFNENFYGVVPSTNQGIVPKWPKSNKKKKIFVYLHSEHTPPQVMKALQQSGYSICTYIKEPKRLLLKYMSENIKLLNSPANMQQVLKESDLVICHAGHGTISNVLMRGIPILMFPLKNNIEQYIVGRNIEKAGNGLCISNPKNVEEILFKMNETLWNINIRERAIQIAKKCTDLNDNGIFEKLFEYGGII